MYCEHCGAKTEEGTKFCPKCGKAMSSGIIKKTSPDSAVVSSTGVQSKYSDVMIKCGNCSYEGSPESGRSVVARVIAWLCVFFAPIITILYFVVTHQYQCPKCKSTFLGVKNKQGVFVSQNSAKRPIMVLLYVLIGIAVIGVLSSIILASLNDARQKAQQATDVSAPEQTTAWQTFNSVADQFSVSLPTYPTLDSSSGTSAAGPYTYDGYTAQSGNEVFFVAKYIYSDQIDTSNPDSILQGGVNAFVNDIAGTLLTSSYTHYDSYRAVDFLATDTNGYYKGRFILVGQTPYLLVMGYDTTDDYNDADYQQFIDSFQAK